MQGISLALPIIMDVARHGLAPSPPPPPSKV